ncbi:MAG: uroporphyrinogen-III C-methyltransferase [Salinisphaeraceae bacterium]
MNEMGEVWLVGAGPGDPDLLTRKAARLLSQADVVLYDSLIQPELLAEIPVHVERIHVGKRASRHTLPQDRINGLMVELALAGKRVLRLKGGDPFVFGRGGEEIAELAAAGIPFEVVPGVTAAQGCAAYAGIPLTHRDCAQRVQFITAHQQSGGELPLDWPCLAGPDQTLVFYMARNTLPTICARLIEHGLPGNWPAALIEDGSTAAQRVIEADLNRLPAAVVAADVSGASLLIVGQVVRLRAQLDWFDHKRDSGSDIDRS